MLAFKPARTILNVVPAEKITQFILSLPKLLDQIKLTNLRCLLEMMVVGVVGR
jgi:hypothetical protein